MRARLRPWKRPAPLWLRRLGWMVGLWAAGKAQTAAIPRGMARICNAAGRFFSRPRPPPRIISASQEDAQGLESSTVRAFMVRGNTLSMKI
jgi:hypothetical protein